MRPIAAIGAALLISHAGLAQSTTLEEVLQSFTPPAPVGTPYELPAEQILLLEDARSASLLGDHDRAWETVRRVRNTLGADADRAVPLFTISAGIAQRQGDLWRATMLLRRVVELTPEDQNARLELALSLSANAGLGSGATKADAWVLADAVGRAEVTPTDRAVMLRLLAGVLDESARAGDARLAREAAAEIASDIQDPELVAIERERREVETIALSLESVLEGVARDPLELQRLVTEALRGSTGAETLAERAGDFGASPEASAVAALLTCEAGRARRADAQIRSALADHPDHPALLAARARSLQLLGDYAQLREIGTALGESAQEHELAALLLDAGGAYEEAELRIERALSLTDQEDDNARLRRSMLASRIAMDRGEADEASRRLLDAHRASPDASAPLRALTLLHAPDGRLPNAELVSFARSRLLAMGDTTHDARVVRAADALRRGYADVAEDELLALAKARPEDPLASRLLVTLWTETDRAMRAVRWLEGQLERRPALSHQRVLLSEAHIARKRIRSSLSTLESWNDDHPGDLVVSRELERVYRDHAREPEQAERLELQRLKRMPASLDALKRRTLILSRIGDPQDLGEALDALLPLADKTGESLGVWSVEVFRRLFRETTRRRPGQVDVTPLIVRLHEGIPSTPLEADEIAIRALASGHEELGPVLDAVRRASDRHPQMTAELALMGAEELFTDARMVATIIAGGREQEIISERMRGALNLANRAVVHTSSAAQPDLVSVAGLDSANALGRALSLLDRVGRTIPDVGEHGRDIADRLLELEDPTPALYAMIDPLNFRDRPLQPALVNNMARAVHGVSYAFVSDDDHTRSDALSLLGLRLAPNDPTINNDLGYRYAERLENLEEAERMTMLAVEQQPGNHSFLDSLGWVRYSMGKLEDTRTQRGAVSLLEEAFRLASAVDDLGSTPVLGDHLGDALWATGRTEDAVRAWATAMPVADRLLNQIQVNANADREDVPGVLLGFLDMRNGIAAKLAAVDAGEEPPIAPPHGPGYTPPPAPGATDRP